MSLHEVIASNVNARRGFIPTKRLKNTAVVTSYTVPEMTYHVLDEMLNLSH